MALRPVSELGLVDLTDLAEPAKTADAPAKAREPKAAQPAKTPRPKAAKVTKVTKAAQPKAAQPKATTPARTKSGGAARRTAARAARAGMVVATWTAAGACGVMLGRAAVRR
jgi:hypothetical protein